MNNYQMVKITGSILTTLLLLSSVSVRAESNSQVIPVNQVQPPSPGEGSASDLTDLDQRNSNTDGLGMGGENTDNISDSSTQEISSEEKDSPFIAEETQQEDWLRYQNHGDVPNQGAKIPFSRF